MSLSDEYRTRAAELYARACNEPDEWTRREYEKLAKQFLLLAEEATGKASVDTRGSVTRA